MKHFSNIKGQAMIFILFVTAIFAILGAGLASMWESEIRTRSHDKEGLIAFYLSQAGVERAKRAVLNNIGFSGNAPLWYNDMDVATDSYVFQYNCAITSAGTQRAITGRGEVLDANNNTLAHREMQVVIDGVQDGDLDGDDDDLSASLAAWSWREI